LRKDIFEKEYNNWGKRTKEYGAYEFVKTLDLKLALIVIEIILL
jgi:hypothetical protein